MARQRILRLSLALALGLGAGCSDLLTATRSFEFDVVQDGQPLAPGQPIALGPGGSAETEIDLGDVDRYEQHRHEIHSVDRAGLVGTLSAPAETSFSVYLSDQAGLADPASEATRILRQMRVPAPGLELRYADTEAALENGDRLRQLVQGGSFWLYLVADGPGSLSVESLRLVVSFTVGL